MNDFFRFPVSGRFDGSMKLWFLRRRRPTQSQTPKPQNPLEMSKQHLNAFSVTPPNVSDAIGWLKTANP